MSKVRFIIVRKPVAEAGQIYLGMDRGPFGGYPDEPESLILEGMALQDIPGEQAEATYRAFWEKLDAHGSHRYDLLALAVQADDDWQFLGYDVGENTGRAWSAVAHRRDFLEPDEIDSWGAKLNVNGLFADPADAKALLAKYLDSGDPDMGWAADGWEEQPDWYAVIPIYRYRGVPRSC